MAHLVRIMVGGRHTMYQYQYYIGVGIDRMGLEYYYGSP